MSYLAGHFRVYFKPFASASGSTIHYLGETKKGIRWVTRKHMRPIQSDRGGQSRVNGIDQGLDVDLTIEWIEYDLAVKALATWGESASSTTFQAITPYRNVGKLVTTLGGDLFAVPVQGTGNATNVGAAKCYRFMMAFPVNDFADLLSSDLREGPLHFACFPMPGHATEGIFDVVDISTVTNADSDAFAG